MFNEIYAQNIVRGLKGAHPIYVWALTSYSIESAAAGRKLSGSVFDLVKAFSFFPKAILRRLLIHVGFLVCVVEPYCCMLAALAGQLVLRGMSVPAGPHQQGCQRAAIWLYCACCFLPNSLLLWLTGPGEAQAIAFADNWAVLSEDCQFLRAAIREVFRFCNVFTPESAPNLSKVY